MIDKEILADFQAESKGLMKELAEIVEKIEDSEGFPAEELRSFSQRIDRIMGAAQTMSTLDASNQALIRIGAIAQVCKQLGYKAAEIQAVPLIPIFAAFWADTIDVMNELIDHVENAAKVQEITNSFGTTLQNRLTWLAGKVNASASTNKANQLDLGQLVNMLNKANMLNKP